MAQFETYKGITAVQIAAVMQVKLPGYRLRDPMIDKIDADNKTEFVFKVMIEAPDSAILQPGEHFMFFVSRLTGKDMDDWLEAAVHKIKAYAAHKSEALKF